MPEKIELLLKDVTAALNRIADIQEKQLEILRGQAEASAEARKQGVGATDLLKTIMAMMPKPSKGA
jgi:hypothetical protein